MKDSEGAIQARLSPLALALMSYNLSSVIFLLTAMLVCVVS